MIHLKLILNKVKSYAKKLNDISQINIEQNKKAYDINESYITN